MVIKLVVAGAAGRMGSRIVQIAQEKPNDFKIEYKLDLKQPSTLSSIPTFGMDSDKIAEADVVIDFTTPEATLEIAKKVAQYEKAVVIGTTGFSPAQEKQLKKILKPVPVLKSANMSLAVNVLFKLAKEVARILDHYDVKIEEKHHMYKKDAPSGTALQLGKIMEEYLERKIVYDSKREGEVIGDHRIIFTGL